MATVFIPPLIRDLTNGQTRVIVPAHSVREAITELETRFPGITGRLCQDGSIRPGMAVVVDSEVSTAGLRHRLSDASEVHFLPAISGG